MMHLHEDHVVETHWASSERPRFDTRYHTRGGAGGILPQVAAGVRRGYIKAPILGFFLWFYDLPRLTQSKKRRPIFTASEGGWGRASGIGCAVEVRDRPELASG